MIYEPLIALIAIGFLKAFILLFYIAVGLVILASLIVSSTATLYLVIVFVVSYLIARKFRLIG